MITKEELDVLVSKYETKDFIKDDPIQFPHKYSDKKDIELVGFISSLFAYGNRKIFIKKLDELFGYMQNEPVNFIKNGDFSVILTNDFNYRFSKSKDIVELLRILSKLYNSSKGLSELFYKGYECNDIISMMQTVVDYFYDNVENPVGQGFYHLLPNPQKQCAMKRMNMFLRWMVRKSDVDLGLWNFIPKCNLLMPLDVHVARLSREMQLIQNNKSNNIKAVKELTSNLRFFDKNDPVKYDFAIFGKGIEESFSKTNLVKV